MTKPFRPPSLLERAAQVYDFGEALRARAPIASEPAPSVEAPSVETPSVEAPSVETPPVATPPELAGIPPEFLARPGDSADDFTPPPIPAGIAVVDRGMLAENGMIVPGAPVGPLAEEFRLLKRQLAVTRRRIVEGGDAAKARTVLICSARPGDGKTFCSINLALSLAADRDTEVLLVDADVAKPSVLRQLGLPDAPGLLDALAGDARDIEELVIRTDVPGLSVLPAGAKSTSDTELLASARTAAAIERLLAANPRRLVIFDSPPALAASPASVLAMLVGQVMLVVRADRTPEAEVIEAADLLDGCEHIQLVLNATSFVPGAHRFGSYYGMEKRS